jgi:hypothetical protein
MDVDGDETIRAGKERAVNGEPARALPAFGPWGDAF